MRRLTMGAEMCGGSTDCGRIAQMDNKTQYGIECQCHGIRIYKTMIERDAAAITFQCAQQLFRVVTA